MIKKHDTFIEKFVKILSDKKIITFGDQETLKKSFAESSQESFDDFLLDQGLVSRKNLLDCLSIYYNVPSFEVMGYFFSHRLLHEFPKDFLLRNRVIPLEVVDDNILFVVANNPADEELLVQFGEYVSYDIQFRVGLAQDIIDAIGEFYDASPTEVPEDEDLRHEHEEQEQAERMLSGDQDDE